MAQLETWLRQDLKQPLKVQYLGGNLFSQDNQANLIGVDVFDEGVAATLGGTVSASVIRADGTTVPVSSGTVSGNKASVVLPQAAYAVPGQVSIVLKLTQSGVVTTLAALVAVVYRSSTDAIVDPGEIIPSIDTLIAEIDAAIASIPADYSTLWQTLAPAFSTQVNYIAGQYVTYNGNWYRFTTNHTAGSFTLGDCVRVNVGGEINDTPLKSEIDLLVEKAFIRAPIEAAAESVENVSMCHAFVNPTSQTDEYGIAPNTVMIAFAGGNATAVANAVKEYIPAGMQTVGNLTIDLDDGTMYLQRPTNAYITATVMLTPGAGYDSTVADLVKQTISDYTYALYIGEGLYATDLLTKIKLATGAACDVTQINFTYSGATQSYGFNGTPSNRWLIRTTQIQIVEN